MEAEHRFFISRFDTGVSVRGGSLRPLDKILLNIIRLYHEIEESSLIIISTADFPSHKIEPFRRKDIATFCRRELFRIIDTAAYCKIEPIKEIDQKLIRRQEKNLSGELKETSLAAFGISCEALFDEAVSPLTKRMAPKNMVNYPKAVRPAVWYKNVVPLTADVFV